MRILHLLASPVFSGPAENVALLALAQRALGHEVSVAIDRKRPGLRSEEPAVPRLRALELLDEGGLELSVKSLPWALASDLFALRRRKVEVVHSHFSHDHVLARWALKSEVTLIRSVHAPRSFRGLPAADGFTVPRAADLQRLPPASPSTVLRPLVARDFRPPSDRTALQEKLGVPGAPVIGMVSTFQPSRNHLLGLEAFARVREARPEAKLVLVGDGELEATLRARVDALQLGPAVFFAGYQSGAAFIEWLQSLDEVWVLGLGNDFTGRAAAQARACGVRVVAVDEGGLPEQADAVLAVRSLNASQLAEASLSGAVRPMTSADNEAIAREVLELYARAGAGR